VAAGCGQRQNSLIIGSENTTEQIVIGEIVAQHLEHRLEKKIERRAGFGNEAILYQGILSGEVTLFPEYPASIAANILKERPDPDPGIVLERTRSEMRRTAQLELLDPLGYESTAVAVIRTSEASKANLSTLSDAANATHLWRLGISYDFQQRSDGLSALSLYKLHTEQGAIAMDAAQLFPALEQNQVNMIIATAADGHLRSPGYFALGDDKKAFPPYQACLLVRQDALAREPRLQAALSELTGKIDTAAIRRLAASIEIEHQQAPAVAAAFLKGIGLR
jgi:glycine betaine/choline ABC-type transport system substrate-binding protein